MRRNWSQEEDELLQEIVSRLGSSDWSLVSQELYQHGKNLHKRTGKQCRQRWHNHLNPKISKNCWSFEQEEKLFDMQKHYGNRWKQLTTHLPGRTDNDIKNKFYSTLRRSLRRLNKLKGVKNSTGQIREIKPSVLSAIINFVYANEHNQNELTESLKQVPELIFRFSVRKPVRANLVQCQEEAMSQHVELIWKLVDSFSSIYWKESTLQTPHQIDKEEQMLVTPRRQQEESENITLPTAPKIIHPIITILPHCSLPTMSPSPPEQHTSNSLEYTDHLGSSSQGFVKVQ